MRDLLQNEIADHNAAILAKERSDPVALAYYLQPSDRIQSNDAEIRALAAALTSGCGRDEERAQAIHDWVCRNICYDYDAYYGRADSGDFSAVGVLQSRRSVCEGYANLTAALLRAAGIPAKQISGYALGLNAGNTFPQDLFSGTVKSNHAWNLAYIDGRWSYLDTCWDSSCRWENGMANLSEKCDQDYFMAENDLFSANHAILHANRYDEIQLYVGFPQYRRGADWFPLDGAAPSVVNGTVMIPLRGVIEGMGGTVEFDRKSDPYWTRITCSIGSSTVHMWLGYDKYFVNGEEHGFQTLPCTVQNCVMVPARELLQAMGCTVAWDGQADDWNGRITIGYAV